MKNLKLALSAVAVMAVVGSALAFKPLTERTLYCTAQSVLESTSAGNCQFAIPNQFLQLEPTTDEPIGRFACKEDAPGVCPLTDIYPSN
jgi:hypothetical protein